MRPGQPSHRRPGHSRDPDRGRRARLEKLLDHKQLTWGFKAEADPGTNGRAIAYPRGRVLGGSSSINGLIYIRSQPEDYDHWAQLGNRGWGWDDVLPFFKRAERWTGDEVLRRHGPVRHIDRSRRRYQAPQTRHWDLSGDPT